MVVEPRNVYPEAEFQRALVALISDILMEKATRFVVVQRFGLDVAVFLQESVRLFEVKAYNAHRPGAVGFGNRRGIGPRSTAFQRFRPLFNGPIREMGTR
jgi:hypothetical protein